MTATLTPTTSTTGSPSLWRTGMRAGVCAAFATVAVAGIATAAGVSLDTLRARPSRSSASASSRWSSRSSAS